MTRLRLAGYHISADDCGILGPECAIRAWVMGRKHQAPLAPCVSYSRSLSADYTGIRTENNPFEG